MALPAITDLPTPDEILGEPTENNATLEELFAEPAEVEEQTLGDALHADDNIVEPELPEEISTDSPEGLYADFEDGTPDTAEEEMERQKGGEEEVVEAATPRAQNRIQKLVSERNEANEQIAAMQQQMLSMQQQMVQSEQARSQRETQRYQAEETLRVASSRATEEQELTAFERYELEQKRATQSALQQMEDRLRNEFNQKEQERQQVMQTRYAEAEKQRRYASVDAQASTAAEEFLKEYSPEDRKGLLELTKTQILVHGAAYKMQPKQAAESLRAYLKTYQKADHQRRLAAQGIKPKGKVKGRVTRPATPADKQKGPDLRKMNDSDIFAHFTRGV